MKRRDITQKDLLDINIINDRIINIGLAFICAFLFFLFYNNICF